jgi:hypothetical protein
MCCSRGVLKLEVTVGSAPIKSLSANDFSSNSSHYQSAGDQLTAAKKKTRHRGGSVLSDR